MITSGLGRSSSHGEWAQTEPNRPCARLDGERKIQKPGVKMETFKFDSDRMTPKATVVYDPKPVAYKAVRVWLTDGSRMWGMWTGTKWWSTKGEIEPVKWELEERKKKTHKLRKAIPRR
jgi:hypothetical protein